MRRKTLILRLMLQAFGLLLSLVLGMPMPTVAQSATPAVATQSASECGFAGLVDIAGWSAEARAAPW
jgi:hypothetical protein